MFDRDDTFLARWLNGTLNETELSEFRQSPDYEDYARIAEGVKGLKPPDFEETAQWQALHKRLGETLPPVRLKHALPGWYLGLLAAAGLALLLVAAWFFKNRSTAVSETAIATAKGEKKTFELPDHSKVTLNAAGAIRYAPGQWDQKRDIFLEGEAYFEVSPGSVFNVLTTAGRATVLGTRFNVSAHSNLETVVRCFEGRISITAGDGNTPKTLKAGEGAALEGGGVRMLQPTSSESPEWLRGESVFQSETLRAVFDELERQYALEVQLIGVDGQRRITGRFVHGDLSKALEMLCKPASLQFEKRDNLLIIR